MAHRDWQRTGRNFQEEIKREKETSTGRRPETRPTRSGVYAELSLLLAEEEDPIRLIVSACTKARKVLSFDRFGFLWLSSSGRTGGTYYHTVPSSDEVTARETAEIHPLVASVIEERKAKSYSGGECASVMSSLLGVSPGLESIVITPIEISGRTLGALILGSEEPKKTTRHDLELMSVLSVHLGSALRVARADQQVQHLASIVQSTDLAVIAYDEEGSITTWNPAATRMLGYSPEEMIGKVVHETVLEEHRASLEQARTEALRGQHTELRGTVHQTKGGQPIEVSATISPIRSESEAIVGVVEILRDVTDQKRAEERFRLAVESSPNAMLIIDGEGRIVLCNGESERLFGYQRDDLIGAPAETLVPPEHRARHVGHRKVFNQRPARRAMGAGRDLYAVRSDGTRVPVEIGLTPIQTPEGFMVLAAIVDITERKHFEEKQTALMQRLRNAVEARDAFLSIASHELRTPLTAAQLTVQSLLRRLSRDPSHIIEPATLENRLSSIERQVHRLSNLVDQLLDVSRIATGRLVLERDTCDLREILDDVKERFSDDGISGPPMLRTRTEEGVVGHWDRGRLDQILTNLISNAFKYGNGKPIDVCIFDAEEFVRIEVRDQGIGIPKDQQERIFDRFERLVSEHHYGGFGLGLWIVRQFVEAHDGSIRVQSEPDRGSTFSVVLPKSGDTSRSRKPTPLETLLNRP